MFPAGSRDGHLADGETSSPSGASRSRTRSSAGVIRTDQTSSQPGSGGGPIRATPALSGPRHARASSIVSTTCPVAASCPPVLSQKPTIPHMPLPSAIENQVERRYQIYWLATARCRQQSTDPTESCRATRCRQAVLQHQKGPAYACPTWKNSLSSSNGDFKMTGSPTC